MDACNLTDARLNRYVRLEISEASVIFLGLFSLVNLYYGIETKLKSSEKVCQNQRIFCYLFDRIGAGY